MRATPDLVCLALLATLQPAERARGQQVLPALAGGAAGLAAGGYVAIGIVSLQARRGEYLYSTDDALGWHASPILIGSGTGFAIGLFDQERLRRTVIGGAIGGILGTGIGTLYGLHKWQPPEGKWAGGVIGGAAGILAGSLVGALWPAPDEEQDGTTGAASGTVVPIGITIRF